jgi:importin subunit beta-1
MSATICLINVTKCVKGQVFDIFHNFISQNVTQRGKPEDWRHREAALTAFGCLVDGPPRSRLLPFVNEAFVFLFGQALQDEHPMVRRSALWTIGRIFESLHRPNAQPPLVTQHNIKTIVDSLLLAVTTDHSMALKACYAIQVCGRPKPLRFGTEAERALCR